ncbi:MAG: response regulator [Spirochaeta sp.]|jgi:two-component system response regulator YesN|nr:response regulator [Spirochaeta sp.]
MAFSVLIADDEPLERAALRDIVDRGQDPPLQVYTAKNGTEALSILTAERIDVAFLDIRMPGRSGLEVAEELRRNDAHVAIVFITAFDYFEYAQSAIRLHAEDYLVKPVDDEVIRRILSRLIDRERNQPTAQPSGRPLASPAVTERFSEVARFLEQELLDDVIAGDIDRAELAAAFKLLGYAAVTGAAVLVRPDLSRYPFRLETDAQRRTVVHRVLRAVEYAMGRPGARFLRRAHRDIGYLIVLSPERDGDTPIPAQLVAAARNAVLEQTSLPATIVASGTFAGITGMSRAIREARLHLNGDVTGSGFPADVPTGATASEGAERQMLRALVHGDAAEVRKSAETLWETVTAGDESADVAGLREQFNRTLGFLLRSARNRGVATPREEEVLLGAHHASRKELRVAFFAATGELIREKSPLPVDTFARRTTEYLRGHYTRDIGLTDLAAYLGLSESHCSREVTRHCGRPFRRLLRETRLQAAQQLLSDPDLAIHDVAERAGFRDPNYFSRIFQETFGMGPREYRNAVIS